VRQLQVGLAKPPLPGFAVPAIEVQVITALVESGHVVEENAGLVSGRCVMTECV
jgi:hypothetical protein